MVLELNNVQCLIDFLYSDNHHVSDDGRRSLFQLFQSLQNSLPRRQNVSDKSDACEATSRGLSIRSALNPVHNSSICTAKVNHSHQLFNKSDSVVYIS